MTLHITSRTDWTPELIERVCCVQADVRKEEMSLSKEAGAGIGVLLVLSGCVLALSAVIAVLCYIPEFLK